MVIIEIFKILGKDVDMIVNELAGITLRKMREKISTDSHELKKEMKQ